MSKDVKNIFKSTKIKAFLLFLTLATIFWILTKFSKEYNATADANINYLNVPSNTLLAENNPKELSFDLTANGFEYFFNKLKHPSIDINIANYHVPGEHTIEISRAELIKLVSSQLEESVDVNNLSIDKLVINLNQVASKKVPVRVITDLSYKIGYRPVAEVRTVPDSVFVSGSEGLLESLEFVATEEFSEENINEDISTELTLINTNAELTLSPKKVIMNLEVAEFSQTEINLPIEVINLPTDMDLKLIPSRITVSFSASLNDFKSINEGVFSLVCDFSERNENETFLIPKLTNQPKGIQNVEFTPKKIEYLIIKK